MTEIFVPGRLCLFGEHSDWAAGYRSADPQLSPGLCLVSGTDQGLRAEASALDGWLEFETRLADGRREGPFRIPARPDDLHRAARQGGFASYIAGAAAEVLARGEAGGLRLAIETDLPVRKGLSSSAASCVLVVRALSALYDLELDLQAEMELAYLGERRAGSECGRMDQICAYGRRASLLHFDGPDLRIEPLDTAAPLHLLVVDLRRGKDTRRILADLNACFPATPGALARGVRQALGPDNLALAARAGDALRGGDAQALGALMQEAQALFDARVAPACPELQAPRLHQVLAHPALAELGYGGKGVGSQGDGCAQLVARGPEERAQLAGRLEADLDVATLPLTLRPGVA